MQIDEKSFSSSIEELNKIKESINNSKDSVDGIIKSISANWKSDASEKFVANFKKSMTTFQTYIDELNKIVLYLKEKMNEFVELEEDNKTIVDSALNTGSGRDSKINSINDSNNTTKKTNFNDYSKEEQNKKNKAALQAALNN